MRKPNARINDSYQVGGSLAWNDSSYVTRQADDDLYNKILQGQFCYVLGPRQIGKSSLRIRTSHRLVQAGYRALSIQATQLYDGAAYQKVGQNTRPQSGWHEQLIASIWDSLYPQDTATLSAWLEATAQLSGDRRLEHFTRDLLFPELLTAPLVIFIDEVDYLLGLPSAVGDLLSWIEKCYGLQANREEYHSLNFVIVGSTTTRALVEASGKGISAQDKEKKSAVKELLSANGKVVLNNFKLSETAPLQIGFTGMLNPLAVLKAILSWTNGQPFLTQKICQMAACQTSTLLNTLSKSAVGRTVVALPTALNRWIEQIVHANIIQDWLLKDDPIHLRTISERLKHSPHYKALMALYRRILTGQRVICNGGKLQQELIVIGLVLCRDQQLHVANKIYLHVFGDRKPRRKRDVGRSPLPGFGLFEYPSLIHRYSPILAYRL